MRLLIATRNQGKVKEYAQLLAAELDLDCVGLADIGLGDMDVAETGATFAENARLKASAYAKASGLLTLSDDSGLVIDALDGRPGVYSARYAGLGASDADRRRKVLAELDGVPHPNRTARFICVIALADPRSDSIALVEGVVEGHILQEECDDGYGFGYDAIFCPQGYSQSFAQLLPHIKHQLSHRGRATQAALPILRQWLARSEA